MSVERVSVIADILKNSGPCNFLYGEKYFVIMHKHSQAYLTKNCHMSLDALNNFHNIIINIIFCGGYFSV